MNVPDFAGLLTARAVQARTPLMPVQAAGYVRAGELAGCPRKLALTLAGTPDTDAISDRMLVKFGECDLHDAMTISDLQRTGVRVGCLNRAVRADVGGVSVSARIKGFVPDADGGLLLEIRNTSLNVTDFQAPLIKHAYLTAFLLTHFRHEDRPARAAVILYKNRTYGTRRQFTLTHDQAQPLMAAAAAVLAGIRAHHDAGTLPAPEALHECGSCRFHTACWGARQDT